MTYETIIGTAAGLITSSAMLPQLIKVIKTKKADHLSVTMICVMSIGLSLWTYYGVLQDEMPIIIFNSFSVLVNLILLVCCLRFKKNKAV